MSPYFPTVPVEVARKKACPPPGGLRPLLLVVDDEPLITETLSAILDSKGFAVLTAHDADEALEICALTPPELLITDVSMPVMNGFDLAVEVKSIASDCEVIFFTGHLNLAEMCTEMGELGNDCVMLLKPVHPADLLEKVSEVLARRRPLQQGRQARSQSLYEFLSSVIHGSDGNSPAWNVTMRNRHRPADTVA